MSSMNAGKNRAWVVFEFVIRNAIIKTRSSIYFSRALPGKGKMNSAGY